ncbi:MAG: competence/damage-inducible protein A [Acidobacteriota bacterium]|nr:competence/damage-inducible protein A [Acidobacteriota bacterium]
MNIEIIAVGTELLSPRFTDTNSLYLIERLGDIGLPVARRTIVGDWGEGLEASLRRAMDFADWILVGGGLGPTGDDRTREAAASALGRGLVFRPDIQAAIEERFRRRERPMAEPNRRQAWIVEGAEVLPNGAGTAPGQWIESGGKILVLLPGPPHELKTVFESSVLPRLAARGRRHASRAVIRTTGLTESEVEALIAELYPESGDCGLTVLASPGRVDLHVSASGEKAGEAEVRLNNLAGKLRDRLGSAVYGGQDDELESVVVRLLREAGATLATAESCTGGLVAHRLTNVPGSSRVFLGGYVAYGNAAKARDLGVDPSIIEAEGAVSEAAAAAMAFGAKRRMGADWALALTGIAGPDGGSESKPVGLVHIALAGPDGMTAERRVFPGLRETVKFLSSQRALDMLRRRLSGIA